jgi:hypothetical protein
VADGGEIWMLDSANYNTATVTVAKSVTILAVPGVVGSVVASSGPALSITTAGLRIALRNLVIVPLVGGSGTDGVRLWAASALSVEGCVFANLPGIGVYVLGDSARARIGNSTFRNVSNASVYVENGGTADVFASQFIDNGNGGVLVYSPGILDTSAYVSDSSFAGGLLGVQTNAVVGGGGGSRVAVTRSTFSNVEYSLVAANSNGAPSSISVSQTLIAGSGTPYSQSGSATIYTLVNNHFFYNGTSTGSLTPISPN